MRIRQHNFLKSAIQLIVYIFLMVSLTCFAAEKDEANKDAVRLAATSLYRALSTKNMSGFAPYIPEQGFSEINPDWQGVRILDRAVLERIFQSGAQIELHIDGLQVSLLDDTHAIVTGYRAGTITPPNAAPQTSKMPLTMVWSKESGSWKLKHVHLSAQ